MATARSAPRRSSIHDVWGGAFGPSADGAKLRALALWGAMGCLAGALLGEFLFLLNPRPIVPQMRVCLLLDCSGSMLRFGEPGRTKLQEVKTAADAFIARQNLSRCRVAVVGFGDSVHSGSPLSADKARLQQSVDALNDGGGTNMTAALERAARELPSPAGAKPAAESNGAAAAENNILLFTDGQPDNPLATLRAANACRAEGIRIVAIGAGDADMSFLARVTGDPKLVFLASAGAFGESFQQAEKALRGGSLVESESRGQTFWKSLALLIVWTALLGAGTSLALIAGQNLYLRRPLLSRDELRVGAVGGLSAGAAAGTIGQIVYSLATIAADAPLIAAIAPLLVFIGRVAGWLTLGALVGRGLALFIPNLAPRNAWLGGALGGLFGSLAFEIASFAGDTIGRLLGGAILGAMIGMMLALAEAVSRQAWLEVYFGERESVRITLGAELVKVGGDSRACVVYARGARPVAMGYRFADNRVERIDYATETSATAAPGDTRTIGAVKVVVRTSAAPLGDASLSDGARSGPVPPSAPSRAPAPLKPPLAPPAALPASQTAPPIAASADPAAVTTAMNATNSPAKPTGASPAPPPPRKPPSSGAASPVESANRTIHPIPPPAPPQRL